RSLSFLAQTTENDQTAPQQRATVSETQNHIAHHRISCSQGLFLRSTPSLAPDALCRGDTGYDQRRTTCPRATLHRAAASSFCPVRHRPVRTRKLRYELSPLLDSGMDEHWHRAMGTRPRKHHFYNPQQHPASAPSEGKSSA